MIYPVDSAIQRLNNWGQMVVLVCQEKKMDTAVILLCRILMQGKMLCFKTQMGSKESSISFLLVEKEEKKLLAEQRFALKDFKLVG